ncbi:thiamin pyrophosphokinase [hydrocarbon metagenome]|uniref:Thiamin pyrophosphokinase n=1 Tax=hydrocarbon metagenome TaxID=938273 RepID=A0A0W8E4J2_9ZZZZ
MRCIVLANGEYGDLKFYEDVFKGCDIILCADGGANYAYQLGVLPDYIIGDMDSINENILEYYNSRQVPFKKYPRRKDFTDIQLAMSTAEEMGAQEIILLGTQGKRFDHSLSNLYCGLEYVKRGIKIIHYGPECTVYLVCSQMSLQGRAGDLVSVLPLGGVAAGVYLKDFEYPLENVVLECDNPYAVSNVLAEDTAQIELENGVLVIFHYPS